MALLVLMAGASGGSVSHLLRGDQERRTVLNALRPAVEVQMHGAVEFVISRIAVDNDWVFVIAEP